MHKICIKYYSGGRTLTTEEKGGNMSKEPQGKKRYSLVVAEDLFDELQELAEQKDTSVVELIRKFIRLGLIVSKAENSPDTTFLLKKGDEVQQILIV
jgi:hypothetical protein